MKHILKVACTLPAGYMNSAYGAGNSTCGTQPAFCYFIETFMFLSFSEVVTSPRLANRFMTPFKMFTPILSFTKGNVK